jgi:hypothetical protein
MRTLALFTGVLTAFNLMTPFANLIRTLHQIAAPNIWLALMKIGGTAFASLVAGVGLLFFFALYRDRGTLHVSRRLRFLGRGAALLLGLILAADLPGRTKGALRDPTLASMPNAVNLLLMGFSIMLLIALSRDPIDKPSEEVPVGRLLRVASELSAKMAGLVLIFAVLGLLVAPYSYSLSRRSVYEPGLTDVLIPQIRAVLLQLCGFVIPLIVYRASRLEERADAVIADEGI